MQQMKTRQAEPPSVIAHVTVQDALEAVHAMVSTGTSLPEAVVAVIDALEDLGRGDLVDDLAHSTL